VVGLRSIISSGAVVEDSLLMGADYYETAVQRAAIVASEASRLGIGRNSVIKKCIIDKNVRIGDKCPGTGGLLCFVAL